MANAVQRPVDARASNAAVRDGSIVIEFDGTERDVENVGGFTVALLIEGTQFTDGSIKRGVRVLANDFREDPDVHCCLNEAVLAADGARRLGQALIDAADEMDGLAAL